MQWIFLIKKPNFICNNRIHFSWNENVLCNQKFTLIKHSSSINLPCLQKVPHFKRQLSNTLNCNRPDIYTPPVGHYRQHSALYKQNRLSAAHAMRRTSSGRQRLTNCQSCEIRPLFSSIVKCSSLRGATQNVNRTSSGCFCFCVCLLV